MIFFHGFSNENKNYEKQRRFLSEIIDPLKVMWLSDEVREWVCFITGNNC